MKLQDLPKLPVFDKSQTWLRQYISKSEESTVSLKDPVESFAFKTFHMDLIDSGGTKTIYREVGFRHYIQSLLCEEYGAIETLKLKKKKFKFRDSIIKESNEKVKISVIIAPISATITIDVVEYYIPFSLSKKAIKRLNHKKIFKKINCIC